jgi:Protocatechuate 3,4-dioxygenase beta subunit
VTLGKTPSQTVGPYYAIGLCRTLDNELAERGSPGALQLTGLVLDGEGTPVNDAMVEIFAAADKRWGRSGTDADGRFSFVVSKPAAVAGEAPDRKSVV